MTALRANFRSELCALLAAEVDIEGGAGRLLHDEVEAAGDVAAARLLGALAGGTRRPPAHPAPPPLLSQHSSQYLHHTRTLTQTRESLETASMWGSGAAPFLFFDWDDKALAGLAEAVMATTSKRASSAVTRSNEWGGSSSSRCGPPRC